MISETIIDQAASPASAQASGGTRVLFVVVNEGLSSIFGAMVARPVGMLRSAGVSIDLAVVCSVGDFVRSSSRRRWKTAVRELRRYFDGGFVRLPTAPSRFRRFWSDGATFSWWIHRHYQGDEPLIAHCRGPDAAALAIEARRVRPNLRVLFDMRGLRYAEHLQIYGCRDLASAPPHVVEKATRIRELERCAAVEADAVICVSQAMADQLVSEFEIPAEKVRVVWNHLLASEYEEALQNRDATRESLGMSEQFVMSYCGSFEAWQPADVCLDAFLSVRQHAPDARLLVLTRHVSAVQDSLMRKGVSDQDVIVRSVPHYEVPRYLAAADVGIIPRGLSNGPHLADRVCAPVKFAEYLASGTPVMMSEGIGDYSELTSAEQVGVVLPEDSNTAMQSALLREFLDAYRAEPQAWRSRCLRVAESHLDSGVHLRKVADLYSELSQ